MRAFCLTDQRLYVTLYNTYVRPLLTYASPVWNPGLRKDQISLEKLVWKFKRRVAFRCSCDINDIDIAPISDYINKIDIDTFTDMEAKQPAMSSKMFNIRYNSTRSGRNITPKSIATKN